MISVYDLREMSEADFERAETRGLPFPFWLKVIAREEIDGFSICRVTDFSEVFEITRLGPFAICKCGKESPEGFCCDHILMTLPKICFRCMGREVSKRGQICSRCEQENAPYLKRSSDKKPEKIGKIRI